MDINYENLKKLYDHIFLSIEPSRIVNLCDSSYKYKTPVPFNYPYVEKFEDRIYREGCYSILGFCSSVDLESIIEKYNFDYIKWSIDYTGIDFYSDRDLWDFIFDSSGKLTLLTRLKALIEYGKDTVKKAIVSGDTNFTNSNILNLKSLYGN